MRYARIVRREIGHPTLDVQPPYDFLCAALEDLDDRALGLAAEARPFDARSNPIAMHDFTHLLRREVDLRRPVVGQQPTLAITLRLHRTDREAGQLLT